LRYQPMFFQRDVLDLGVGAGRTARYLAPLARRYESIDYSQVMVDSMGEALPGVSVRLGDMRDLSAFASESFDFVLAAYNLISAVSHVDRLQVLREIHRVLRSGSIFMFAAHNRNCRNAGRGPRLRWSRNPVTLARNLGSYVQSVPNYLTTRSAYGNNPDYAIFSDYGHDYALLHYYIDRVTQARQLRNAGFRLLAHYDEEGRILTTGDNDEENFFLLYVAEKI
jgi:SAM-dependent methyltransferase